MGPLKAASCRPHALHIFVKRAHLFIDPRLLRLQIGAAQLIECLTDGEFVYFLPLQNPRPMKQTGENAARHPALTLTYSRTGVRSCSDPVSALKPRANDLFPIGKARHGGRHQAVRLRCPLCANALSCIAKKDDDFHFRLLATLM